MNDSSENSSGEGKDSREAVRLYAVLSAGCILTPVLRFETVSMIGSALVLAVLIVAYFYRGRAAGDPESLRHNHGTFLIRTIWLGTLYVFLGFIAGLVAIYFMVDKSAVFSVMAQAEQGNIITPQTMEQAVNEMTVDNADIFGTLYLVASLSLAPGLVWMLIRAGRGASRASSGHRILGNRH